jgi:ATP-dependent DNA helicase RecQ
LAVGSGKDEFMEFDLMDFCKVYNLNHLKVHKSLDLLSRNAYINLTEAVFMPSRLMFKVNKNELYSYQVKYPKMDLVIKTILRSYSGIFDEFTPIKEKDIAFRTKLSVEQVIKDLELLQKHEIIQYVKQSILPKICFPNGIILAKNLFLEKDSYENRKKQVEIRNGAFIQLLKNEEICRNQQMLGYFGEKDSEPCGRCDVCIQKRKKDPSTNQLLNMEDQIMLWIKEKSVEYDWVVEQFESKNEVREIIRHLMENGRIVQEGKWLKFQR